MKDDEDLLYLLGLLLSLTIGAVSVVSYMVLW